MAQFLSTCRYVGDQEQFGVKDYWMPPEEFEKSRQGDNDCAAIWAWRQLTEMGYESRYVVGDVGESLGHAWVFMKQCTDWYLIEPFAARREMTFPTLYTLQHKPRLSASWDGLKVRYYEHRELNFKPTTMQALLLLFESTKYRAGAYSRYGHRKLISALWSLRKTAIHTSGESTVTLEPRLEPYLLRPSSVPCSPKQSEK